MAKSRASIALEAELGLAQPDEIEMLDEVERKQDAFLVAYRTLGTIKEACAVTHVSRQAVHRWRKDDAHFLEAFDQADIEFTEHLESIVLDRAKNKSDILLMFALKKRVPAYRENFKVEHSGDVAVRIIRYDDPTLDIEDSTSIPAELVAPSVVESSIVSPPPIPSQTGTPE